MAATFEGIERELAAADVVFTAARRAQRHPAFAIAGSVLTALAPLAARTVVRRALWIVPLAIAGYRVVKALRRGRS
jgi:hypothetical protein